jgi:hypothetical protein
MPPTNLRMKVDAEPAARRPGAWSRALRMYEDSTGHFFLTWALVALLNFVTQAVFFFEMAGTARVTGEFGIFNAALGIIGLLALPAQALPVAHRLFFARAQSTSLDPLRAASFTVTETFAWVWAFGCFVLILLPLPLPTLPRFALEIFTLLNALLALGAVVSGAVCAEALHDRRWALLLVCACLVRLALGAWFTAYQPWSEVALGAYLVAGFVTLAPALRPREMRFAARLQACVSALDRSFLRFTAATLSVLLGLYLFTNADRIAALSWMNVNVGGTELPSSPLRHILDVYQAVGLLARAILWGTQPLLWLLYFERSRLDKTTPASLRFFWVYLAALLAGALGLGLLGRKDGPLDALIPQAGSLAPTFAAVMVPLGLLQGLGIFALASRRYPECFVIGGCGFVYALVLAIVGGRPQTMLPYMFGSSVVALMLVLFVGVVRWGRRQP